MDTQALKQRAADAALEEIRSGMVIGLGSGSTAALFMRGLGRRVREGVIRDVVGVPTSEAVGAEASQLGLSLVLLEDTPFVDVTVDGADEVDPGLNLIKGGGGALLREKLVAQASRRVIVVVDQSKLAPQLGTRWHVPVEVIPFGWQHQARHLESLGAAVQLRLNQDKDAPFRSDEGNFILDCRFGIIDDPASLGQVIKARTGIVEHGIFTDLASEVIVAEPSGIRRLVRN